MPSSEQQPGEGTPEQEAQPYIQVARQVARFPGEQPAGRAYFQAQRAIFKVECDLSAYRFHLNRIWHVAVVGEQPPEKLAQQLTDILGAGEPTTLPPDILACAHGGDMVAVLCPVPGDGPRARRHTDRNRAGSAGNLEWPPPNTTRAPPVLGSVRAACCFTGPSTCRHSRDEPTAGKQRQP